MATDQDIRPVSQRRQPASAETLRAILFMMLGFFLYSVSDTLSKVLTESVNPLQIAWLRQLGLASGILVLLAVKGPKLLRSRHPVLQICRGLTVVAAATSFLFALAYVPITDATAVSFLAPFIVTVLAAIFLRETVGIRRGIAVTCGFIGTMIVVRPGLGAFHPAIFLVLIAAAAFALRQIISRLVSGTDSLTTTVAYTSLTAALILSFPLPFVWSNPADVPQLLLMMGVACIAGSGELFIIRALDIGEAVVLSSLQYSLIIWSTLWGFLVFAELPDFWTQIGTAIVIASGIYTIYREARAGPRPDLLREP